MARRVSGDRLVSSSNGRSSAVIAAVFGAFEVEQTLALFGFVWSRRRALA